MARGSASTNKRKTRKTTKPAPKGRVRGGGVRVNSDSKGPKRIDRTQSSHMSGTRKVQKNDLNKQNHKNNVGRVKNRVRRTRNK